MFLYFSIFWKWNPICLISIYSPLLANAICSKYRILFFHEFLQELTGYLVSLLPLRSLCLWCSALLSTGWKEGWQRGHHLWLASVGGIRSPWGVFAWRFGEGFSRPHWTDNDEGSGPPIAFNHLLTVPARWLFSNSSFLAPGPAEAWGKNSSGVGCSEVHFQFPVNVQSEVLFRENLRSCLWPKGMQKSDRCTMREEAAFNHFVVKAALDRPLKKAFFLLLLENSRLILSPFADSFTRRLKSAPYARLPDGRASLRSPPVYTFPFQRRPWDPFALTR